MRISTIAFANLKRRKAKAAFLIVGMAIGIGTAVALLSLSFAIKDEIGVQLDQFGANIVVVPQSNSLALDYGGVTVSGVSFDVHQLKGEDAKNILDIEYGNRLSIIAPKLLGAIQVDGRDVLLAGVDFENELNMKRWWQIVGRVPAAADDLLVGYDAARALGLIEPSADGIAASNMREMPDMPGMDHNKPVQSFTITRDRVQIAGREHRVASVLVQTGGREDGMIFGSLGHVQSLLGKPDQLSLIEVSALCQNCPIEDIVAQISTKLPARQGVRRTTVGSSANRNRRAPDPIFSCGVGGRAGDRVVDDLHDDDGIGRRAHQRDRSNARDRVSQNSHHKGTDDRGRGYQRGGRRAGLDCGNAGELGRAAVLRRGRELSSQPDARAGFDSRGAL